MNSLKKKIESRVSGLQWSVTNSNRTRQLCWGYSVTLERQDDACIKQRSFLRVYLHTEIDGECLQVLDTNLFGQDGYYAACSQAKAFIRNNVAPLIPELIGNLFSPVTGPHAGVAKPRASDLSSVRIHCPSTLRECLQ